jgi:hypothetical protein
MVPLSPQLLGQSVVPLDPLLQIAQVAKANAVLILTNAMTGIDLAVLSGTEAFQFLDQALAVHK